MKKHTPQELEAKIKPLARKILQKANAGCPESLDLFQTYEQMRTCYQILPATVPRCALKLVRWCARYPKLVTPRIFFTYYPNSYRGFYRVSPLPVPSEPAFRELWAKAHEFVQRLNNNVYDKLEAEKTPGTKSNAEEVAVLYPNRPAWSRR